MASVDDILTSARSFVARGRAELIQGIVRGRAELSQGIANRWKDALTRIDAAKRNKLQLPLPLSLPFASIGRSNEAHSNGGLRPQGPSRVLEGALSAKERAELTGGAEPRKSGRAARHDSVLATIKIATRDGEGSKVDPIRLDQLPAIRTSMPQQSDLRRRSMGGGRADGDRKADASRPAVGLPAPVDRAKGAMQDNAVQAGGRTKAAASGRFEDLSDVMFSEEEDEGVVLPPLPPASPHSRENHSKHSISSSSSSSSSRLPSHLLEEHPSSLRMRADGSEEWAGRAPEFLRRAAEESGPASKEQLGRATWTFLHTLAAQFPEKPSRQQQRDAQDFVKLLAKVYPCKICSYHFQKIIESNPPKAGSRTEMEQYMCRLHNIVNRSLKKPEFPCHRVQARWGSLECEDKACEL